MNRKALLCTLNLSAANVPAAPEACPTRQRLTAAFERLQNIKMVRNHRGDPLFGKAEEERIIWRELTELELQQARGERAD